MWGKRKANKGKSDMKRTDIRRKWKTSPTVLLASQSQSHYFPHISFNEYLLEKKRKNPPQNNKQTNLLLQQARESPLFTGQRPSSNRGA